MAMSGVKLTEECQKTYQAIQKDKTYRYAIFKIADGQINLDKVRNKDRRTGRPKRTTLTNGDLFFARSTGIFAKRSLFLFLRPLWLLSPFAAFLPAAFLCHRPPLSAPAGPPPSSPIARPPARRALIGGRCLFFFGPANFS
jgi:hypothetical protein